MFGKKCWVREIKAAKKKPTKRLEKKVEKPTYFSLRLEKYLNMVAFLEEALKITFPLKSP